MQQSQDGSTSRLPSWYKKYVPWTIQETVMPSTLISAVYLGGHVLATGAGGNAAKEAVAGQSRVIQDVVEQVAKTAISIPTFAGGGGALVYPSLVQKEYLEKWFDCKQEQEHDAPPATDGLSTDAHHNAMQEVRVVSLPIGNESTSAVASPMNTLLLSSDVTPTSTILPTGNVPVAQPELAQPNKMLEVA